MVGFALFGSVYILPAYLGQAQGYNAEQIGTVLAWTGLPQLLLIPLVPKLMQRFDTRYIAFTGLMIFAYSCFMNTAMSPDYAGDQLWIPNIVRAVGQAMVLTPLTSVRWRASRRRTPRPRPASATCCAISAARSARRCSRPSSPSASSSTPTSSASRSRSAARKCATASRR